MRLSLCLFVLATSYVMGVDVSTTTSSDGPPPSSYINLSLDDVVAQILSFLEAGTDVELEIAGGDWDKGTLEDDLKQLNLLKGIRSLKSKHHIVFDDQSCDLGSDDPRTYAAWCHVCRGPTRLSRHDFQDGHEAYVITPSSGMSWRDRPTATIVVQLPTSTPSVHNDEEYEFKGVASGGGSDYELNITAFSLTAVLFFVMSLLLVIMGLCCLHEIDPPTSFVEKPLSINKEY